MSASQERRSLPNYYLTLDLMPGASHNEILHAYNRSKKTYSEGSLASYGLLEGNAGQDILREIEDAFVILGNPSRRREYDMKMGYQTWTEEGQENNNGFAASNHSMMKTLSQAVEDRPQDLHSAPVHQMSGQMHSGQSGTSSSGSSQQPFKPSSNYSNKSAFTPTPSSSVKMKSSFENFEPNPEFEKQIQECKDPDGPFLKAVRIYRRLSEVQLAERCKLSASHIQAVENEELTPSHQPVYLRGHVYLMCQALEIPEPGDLASSYVRRMRDLGKFPKTPY